MLFVVFALHCASSVVDAQATALLIERDDRLNVEAATAVMNVTYTRTDNATVLESPIDNANYTMLIIMADDIQMDVNSTLAVANIEAFANAGGIVLIMGNAVPDDSTILAAIGASNTTKCGENFSGQPINPPSNDTMCDPLTNGGYSDFRGQNVSTLDRENFVSNFFTRECLQAEETDTYVSCVTTLSNATIMAAKPMANGGGVYYMATFESREYYLERSVNYDLYFEAFNNLLVTAGATPLDLSGYPPVDVLYLVARDEDTDYGYYYSTVFRLAAHDNANIVYKGLDAFDEIEEYDMVIWSSANGYYEEYGYVNTSSDMLIDYVRKGGVVLNAMGGGFTYSSTYYNSPELWGIEAYKYCDDWDLDEPYYAFEDFSTDSVCDPLLNGGYRDISGLSPDTDFEFDEALKSLMSIISCMKPSTATPCLTSDAKANYEGYNEFNTLWSVNPMGEQGGVAVTMDFSYNTEVFALASQYKVVAFNNLLVYAATKNLGPTANSTWFVYTDECMRWIPADMPEDTMTITLINPERSSSKVIVENVDTSEGQFSWVAHGVATGTVQLEYSFPEGSPSMLSEEFELVLTETPAERGIGCSA